MIKHFPKLIFIYVLICSILTYLSVTNNIMQETLYVPIIILFGLGMVLWLIATIRTLIFKKKLLTFINRLINGDYKAGIKIDPRANDAITRIAKLFNKLADHIRTYDALRAQSVNFNFRALDLLFRNSHEGIIIAEMEKKSFKLNKSAQTIFDIENANMSFDSIEKQKENKEFTELLKTAIEEGKYYKEGKVTIKLPIRNLTRKLLVKIFPLKDKEEDVKLIIIFLSKIHDIISSEASQI